VVSGAKGAAQALSLDEFVVGALVVALATSAPELAIVVISARRGRGEIGVGALLGSNVFNSLFVVGVAGAITPIAVHGSAVAVAVGFGLVATLATVPDRGGRLATRRGALLVAIYVAYVVTLLLTA
jgi:cation:H+ antiporter